MAATYVCFFSLYFYWWTLTCGNIQLESVRYAYYQRKIDKPSLIYLYGMI